jgi:hypothetical protein
MERSEDHGQIAVALAELRPTPRAEFTRELDEWATAAFPRPSRGGRVRLGAPIVWLRALNPRRLALAGAAAALVAIAIATVVIAGNDSRRGPVALDTAPSKGPTGHQAPSVPFAESLPVHPGRSAGGDASDGSGPYIRPFSRKLPRAANFNALAAGDTSAASTEGESLHFHSRHRAIKHAAEIDLRADPADVSDDSGAVFRAVHAAGGIVLHSSTTAGTDAGARFEMLIPSPKLGDALADISAIDEVRYRREASDDITAPTVTTGEQLRESRARVDSLLTELAGAETEAEREVIEIQLHTERRHAAALRSQLTRLHRRVQYARVQVRIEGDASVTGGGAWGPGDAFHDAGHILGIAAGVTLVGLAVIAPLALLFLLAWLAQRLWLRSRRERALDT